MSNRNVTFSKVDTSGTLAMKMPGQVWSTDLKTIGLLDEPKAYKGLIETNVEFFENESVVPGAILTS